MRGSSTCSFVARSDLSFMFACALGPFLFTLARICWYGVSICAMREEKRGASAAALLFFVYEPEATSCCATFLDVLSGPVDSGQTRHRRSCPCLGCSLPYSLSDACWRSRLKCFVKSAVAMSDSENLACRITKGKVTHRARRPPNLLQTHPRPAHLRLCS